MSHLNMNSSRGKRKVPLVKYESFKGSVTCFNLLRPGFGIYKIGNLILQVNKETSKDKVVSFKRTWLELEELE